MDLRVRVMRKRVFGDLWRYLSIGRSRVCPCLLLSLGLHFLKTLDPQLEETLGKDLNRDLSSTPEKSLGCPPQDKFHFVVWGLRS